MKSANAYKKRHNYIGREVIVLENVIILDGKKYYRYHTLYVTEEGEVFNAKFKKMTPKDNALWFSTLSAERNIDGTIKRKKHKVNRIVYEAITGEKVSSSCRVINKDGDLDNYSFDNLEVVKISDLPVTYDFSKYYKISAEDRAKIQEDKTHSAAELAKEYNVTVATIQKIQSGCTGKGWHERIKNVENESKRKKAL